MNKAATTIDTRTRQRIGKSIAMGDADNDHLALVAFRTASRLARDAGTTLQDLICQTLPAPADDSGWWDDEPQDPRQADLFEDWPTKWKQAVAFCAERLDQLAVRDAAFIQTLSNYRRQPSDAQCKWLRDVTTRVQTQAAA